MSEMKKEMAFGDRASGGGRGGPGGGRGGGREDRGGGGEMLHACDPAPARVAAPQKICKWSAPTKRQVCKVLTHPSSR